MLSMILFFILCLIIYMIFGKDYPIITTVNFDVPKDINSAELCYILESEFTTESIVSLFVFWASLGVIEIEEIGRKNLRFKKVKELQSKSQEEMRFFNEIFYNRDSVSSLNLKDNFYVAIDYAKQYFKERFTKSYPIYDATSSKIQGIMSIGLTLVLLLSLIVLGDISIDNSYLWLIAMMTYIGIVANIQMIETFRRKPSFYMLLMIAELVFLSFLVLIFGIRYNLNILHLSLILIFFILSLFLVARMKRLSKKGAYLFGQVLGLRRYVELVELKQIEMFAEKEPQRYYELLSYAYAFGLSEVWLSKLKRMTYTSQAFVETLEIQSELNHMVAGFNRH